MLCDADMALQRLRMIAGAGAEVLRAGRLGSQPGAGGDATASDERPGVLPDSQAGADDCGSGGGRRHPDPHLAEVIQYRSRREM